VTQTVMLSFLALATTLVYLDLRLRREGAGPGRGSLGDEGGGPAA
jgi:hypothetical protein